MNARRIHRTKAGFTLIEILVALGIMAVLAITGYRSLAGMIDGEQRITQERQRWRELDLFFSRLEYDLGHALPRAYRLGNTGFPGVFLRDNAVALVRGVPGELPQRIGYRLSDTRIELLYWPQLDAVAPTAPVAYTIAENVASWQLEFANRQGEWLERWGEAGAQVEDLPMPRGAHVVLVLNDGTRIERVFSLQ